MRNIKFRGLTHTPIKKLVAMEKLAPHAHRRGMMGERVDDVIQAMPPSRHVPLYNECIVGCTMHSRWNSLLEVGLRVIHCQRGKILAGAEFIVGPLLRQ